MSKFLLFAAALLSVLGQGCHRGSRPEQIVFILLDAARADHFSCYGYRQMTTPNIDDLAANGTIFLNHFTQGINTPEGLPAILYSRYFVRPFLPCSSRVPMSHPADVARSVDDEAVPVQVVFAQNGYRSVLITAHPWFRAQHEARRDWDEFYPLAELINQPGTRTPQADRVIDYTLEWIEENRTDRFFLFVHLMDTHFPHFLTKEALHFLGGEEPEHSDTRRFTKGGSPSDDSMLFEGLSPRERRYLDAVYDGSLRFTDRHVGRLIDRLEAGDSDHQPLIVITADHGDSLLEQPGRFAHGDAWWEEIARVPWIVNYPPRLAPKRVTTMTEGIDIAPTILGLVGIDIPIGARMDGIDVLGSGLFSRTEERSYVFSAHGMRGLRYKLLFDDRYDRLESLPNNEVIGRAPSFPRARLYDLEADPLETHDVASAGPEILKSLTEIYRKKMAERLRRFRESVSFEPVECRFAIPAIHFSTMPRLPRVDFRGSVEAHRIITVEPELHGWYRSNHFARSWLYADRSAKGLKIEFQVPNGRYEVTAAVRGRGRFLYSNGGAVSFDAEPLVDVREILKFAPVAASHVDVGTVEVTADLFSVIIEPEVLESGFFIKYFGFRPLMNPEAESHEDRRQREEQLRALGYAD